jgi:hypothetical protein
MDYKTYEVTEPDNTIDLLYHSVFNRNAGFLKNGYSHYRFISGKEILIVPVSVLIYMAGELGKRYICKIEGLFYKYYKFSFDMIRHEVKLFGLLSSNIKRKQSIVDDIDGIVVPNYEEWVSNCKKLSDKHLSYD